MLSRVAARMAASVQSQYTACACREKDHGWACGRACRSERPSSTRTTACFGAVDRGSKAAPTELEQAQQHDGASAKPRYKRSVCQSFRSVLQRAGVYNATWRTSMGSGWMHALGVVQAGNCCVCEGPAREMGRFEMGGAARGCNRDAKPTRRASHAVRRRG